MGEVVRVGDAEAEIIEHSVVYNSNGVAIPLVTVRTRYWRAIHSELMTHCVFSRNARSSRAVPTPRLLAEDPYIPDFGMNIPGMQAGDALSPEDNAACQSIWQDMIDYCRAGVKQLHERKAHKQWANRPLEWFGWIDTLITATDWANFFALRDHYKAAPEIRDLACAIRAAIEGSTPAVRSPYDDHSERGWHLPYCTAEDRLTYALPALQQMSAARCARISYTPFDSDTADITKDLELFRGLLVEQPIHASPAGHQGCPDMIVETNIGKATVTHWAHPEEHGNFYGWRQFRKTIPNESVKDAHYAQNI